MHPALLISIYSVAVVAGSLFGGWLPSLFQLTHVRMQVMLSFVGGVMLGVGVLHMLPHSYVQTGSLDQTLNWTLIGLLGMFLLIRTFHFHEHGPAASDPCDAPDPADLGHTDHAHGASADDHHHDHGHAHTAPAMSSSLSWIGVAFGLSLHALLDGVALGAGVLSETVHGEPLSPWAGLGIFLAILLHKPLDALSITTLMQARGWSRRSQQAVNAGFAMMCPIGAWGLYLWVDAGSNPQSHLALGIALAISAGIFLCISLSDLLPEVQFHRHDRLKLSAALIVGVLCAYAIRYLEPEHAHDHGHSHSHASATSGKAFESGYFAPFSPPAGKAIVSGFRDSSSCGNEGNG